MQLSISKSKDCTLLLLVYLCKKPGIRCSHLFNVESLLSHMCRGSVIGEEISWNHRYEATPDEFPAVFSLNQNATAPFGRNLDCGDSDWRLSLDRLRDWSYVGRNALLNISVAILPGFLIKWDSKIYVLPPDSSQRKLRIRIGASQFRRELNAFLQPLFLTFIRLRIESFR